jgi:hypothetical protein
VLNAAALRASGEYIGRIDQDTLVGRRFFETFFRLREKQRLLAPLDSVVMISNRRSIPYRFAVRCPSLWIVDRYTTKPETRDPMRELVLGGGATLMGERAYVADHAPGDRTPEALGPASPTASYRWR